MVIETLIIPIKRETSIFFKEKEIKETIKYMNLIKFGKPMSKCLTT